MTRECRLESLLGARDSVARLCRLRHGASATGCSAPSKEIAHCRAREISFSQGAVWKALMRTYIGIMPVSGEAPQSISSGPPPRTAVSSAMTAKVGAAARDRQSAAPPSDVPLMDGPLVDGQARPGLSGPPSLFMQLIVAAMQFT